MKRYLILIESAKVNIREAIEFHLEGLREEGCSLPEPSVQTAFVEIAA